VAVSFSIADLPTLANLAQAHPTPTTFWTWVKANTASAELIDIANKMIFDWTAQATTPIAEAKRLADAVQELLSSRLILTLDQVEDDSGGRIRETHLEIRPEGV